MLTIIVGLLLLVTTTLPTPESEIQYVTSKDNKQYLDLDTYIVMNNYQQQNQSDSKMDGSFPHFILTYFVIFILMFMSYNDSNAGMHLDAFCFY